MPTVWQVSAGPTKRRYSEVLLQHGVALISKGLQAGETVVVQGQYRLTPGTLVAAAAPSETPNPSTASSGMLP